MGRPELAENYKKPEWKTWFEARRAMQVSKGATEKAVVTPRQTVVDVQEATASLKPRGKYVVYTEASYKRTHNGRTYNDWSEREKPMMESRWHEGDDVLQGR